MKMQNHLTSLVAVALIGMFVVAGCSSEVDRLSKQLQNPDSMVRWEAAGKLGATNDPEAIAPLIAALGDSEEEVRNAATDSLASIGKPAVPALGRAIQSATPEVKELILITLGQIGDAGSTKLVMNCLLDESAKVKVAAAGALGRIGDASAVSALEAAKEDPDEAVKAAVEAALSQINK